MNVEPMSVGGSDVVARANPCPDSDFCLKQLEFNALVTSTTSQTPVAPGGTYEVAAVYINHALIIDITDADRCSNDANLCSATSGLDPGYCVLTGFFPPGADVNNQFVRKCVPIDQVNPPNQESVHYKFKAPVEPGVYEISANAQFEGSVQSTPLLFGDVYVEEGGEGDSTIDDGGSTDGTDFNLIEWAVNNPGQAVLAMIVIVIFVSSLAESLSPI